MKGKHNRVKSNRKGTQWKVNLKQSLYRPWKFQEFEAPRLQENRHMKVVSLSALLTGRLYPCKIPLVLISIRGRTDPIATARPEELCQWKIPMTPSGIEPTTFRLMAQCPQKNLIFRIIWSLYTHWSVKMQH